MEAVDLSRRMADFGQVAGEVLRDVQDVTEQQIRHWIVNPYLVALGWDPHDKRQVYPDYPAKGDGRPIASITRALSIPWISMMVRSSSPCSERW